MVSLSLSFLGPFEVRLEGRLAAFATDRARALLAYLGLEANRPHRRETLAALLWPNQPEEAALRNLTQTLVRLRQAIGDYQASPPFLQITPRTIALKAETVELDVVRFQSLAAASASHSHPGPAVCPACLERLEEAADLYRGEFLQGLFLTGSEPFEEWALFRREQLYRQALDIMYQLTVHYDDQTDYARAQRYAERQLALEPWREEAHQQLMRVLALGGHRRAALAQYETCCRILAEELGVTPLAETTTLYEQIRAGVLGRRAETWPLSAHTGTPPSHTMPAQAGMAPSVSLSPGFSTPAPPPDLKAILRRLDSWANPRLLGVEAIQSRLEQAVQAQGQPWVIAVCGMGGLGKTSLVQALVRAVVPTRRFDHIVWISARQEGLLESRLEPPGDPLSSSETFVDVLLAQLDPALPLARPAEEKLALLTHWLRTSSYLIVVDDLEAAYDLESLLALFRRLANPTKFLVTSRYSLYADSSGIECVGLRELSRADAQALLENEGARRDIPALTQVTQIQLDKIYRIVGGNPLALKLVAGQLGILPLAFALKNLEQAADRTVQELYTYLYWQTWGRLTAPGKQVLVAMLLAQDGTFEDLLRESELDGLTLGRSLQELIRLSLVEVSGDIEQPRYRIHNLTETFLLTEVINRSDGASLPSAFPQVDFFHHRVEQSARYWHD